MGICKVYIQEPSGNNMGTFGIGTLSESAAQGHLSRMTLGTGKCSSPDIGKADGYHLLRDLPGIDHNRLHEAPGFQLPLPDHAQGLKPSCVFLHLNCLNYE